MLENQVLDEGALQFGSAVGSNFVSNLVDEKVQRGLFYLQVALLRLFNRCVSLGVAALLTVLPELAMVSAQDFGNQHFEFVVEDPGDDRLLAKYPLRLVLLVAERLQNRYQVGARQMHRQVELADCETYRLNPVEYEHL